MSQLWRNQVASLCSGFPHLTLVLFCFVLGWVLLGMLTFNISGRKLDRFCICKCSGFTVLVGRLIHSEGWFPLPLIYPMKCFSAYFIIFKKKFSLSLSFCLLTLWLPFIFWAFHQCDFCVLPALWWAGLYILLPSLSRGISFQIEFIWEKALLQGSVDSATTSSPPAVLARAFC